MIDKNDNKDFILSEKKVISDSQEIVELLMMAMRNEDKWAIWQEEKGTVRGQPFCWGRIIGIKGGNLEFKLEYVRKVRINKSNHTFVYGYNENIICKLPIMRVGLNFLIVPIPKELLRVEVNYLEKRNIISQADEKKFMIQRAEKRSKSEGDSFTEFNKTGFHDNKSQKFHLYDLSPHGMSFLLHSSEGFEVENEIAIDHINKKLFDPPLRGEIRSIKEMDDGQFKVGVFFKTQEQKKSA